MTNAFLSRKVEQKYSPEKTSGDDAYVKILAELEKQAMVPMQFKGGKAYAIPK